MKMSKVVILLAIALIMANTLAVKRKTKVPVPGAKEVSAGAGGSWKEGFVCSSIKINVNKIQVIEAENVRFFPETLKTAAVFPETIGWTFTMLQPPKENLKKIMIQADKNKWYIPFRFMTGKFKFDHHFGGSKKISGWATNDNGETMIITIEFYYSYFKTFLTNQEGDTIVSLINSLVNKHQMNIKTAKAGATDAAAKYSGAKPYFEAAKGDESKMKEEITKQKTKLQEIETEIEKDKQTASAVSSEIENLKTQMTEKENNLNSLQAKINSMSSDAASIKDLLIKLNTNNSPNEDKKNSMSLLVSSSLTELNLHLTMLKNEVPTKVEDISRAEAAVKDMNNKEFVKIMNTVYPL